MHQNIQQQWPSLLDSVREAARDIFQHARSGRQLTQRKSDGSLLTATDIALQESMK